MLVGRLGVFVSEDCEGSDGEAAAPRSGNRQLPASQDAPDFLMFLDVVVVVLVLVRVIAFVVGSYLVFDVVLLKDAADFMANGAALAAARAFRTGQMGQSARAYLFPHPSKFMTFAAAPLAEPILFPKLRIYFADFPYLLCSIDQRLLTLETC